MARDTLSGYMHTPDRRRATRPPVRHAVTARWSFRRRKTHLFISPIYSLALGSGKAVMVRFDFRSRAPHTRRVSRSWAIPEDLSANVTAVSAVAEALMHVTPRRVVAIRFTWSQALAVHDSL